jgi:flagellar biosynthesis protein FlhG
MMYEQASKLRQIMADICTSKISSGNLKVYCITSGKGGVGKTNISVNIALALQCLGKRVLLIDADLGLANVDVVTGLYPKHNISHLLNSDSLIEDVLLKGPMGVMILPGASGLYDLANISTFELSTLIDAFNKVKKDFDYILIDTGAGISKNVLSFIQASDEVIVVTTPEPSAVTDAYAIIKLIHKHFEQINVIVNRVDNFKEADYTMEKLTRASQKFLNAHITYLGYVLEDKSVYRSNMEQIPFYVKYPNGFASKCITNISKQMLYGVQKQQKTADRTIGSWFKKLLNLMRNEGGGKVIE